MTREMRAAMGRGLDSSSRSRFFLPVFLVTLSILLAGVTTSAQETAFDLVGNPADPFKAAAGKAIVFIFVRTDCPVSNRYAPTIQRLSTANAGKAAFWLVYPSKGESAEAVRKHDRDYGYQIPALRDPQHVLVKESRAQVTPEAAVFDSNRRLVYHGRIDDLYVDMTRARTAPTTHELADAIQAAISGKSLAADSKPGVGCYISDLE